MANLSLLQTVLSSWPVRAGAVAFGATTTGGLAIRYSDYTSRQVSLRMDITTSVPVAAGTTLFNDDEFNQLLNLEAVGTIATHTVTLPSDSNSVVGQEVIISTLFQITALTINGATTIRGYSAPFLLAAGLSKRLVKIAADTWAII
jgi:hypothetical protein